MSEDNNYNYRKDNTMSVTNATISTAYTALEGLVSLHESRVRNALKRLVQASSEARIRRPGHGVERAQSVEMRRFRRSLRRLRAAREALHKVRGDN